MFFSFHLHFYSPLLFFPENIKTANGFLFPMKYISFARLKVKHYQYLGLEAKRVPDFNLGASFLQTNHFTSGIDSHCEGVHFFFAKKEEESCYVFEKTNRNYYFFLFF